MIVQFGRDTCSDFQAASQKEWLVTNRIGGFASGTISGSLTRRYHGLLIAALKPPLGRTLLVTKVEEIIHLGKVDYELSANHWSCGAIHPHGYRYIERFFLDQSIPTWIYALGDGLLEKKIWMQPGENTTYVRYRYFRTVPNVIRLDLRVLVNARDYHSASHLNQAPNIRIEAIPDGLSLFANDFQTAYYLRSANAPVDILNTWQTNLYYPVEAERGESCVEDHLAAGSFYAELHPEQSLTILASTERNASLDGEAALADRYMDEQRIFAAAKILKEPGLRHRPAVEQLILAADQFIVDRPTAGDGQGKTILAGYPWFSDWGRDTMISLPGLTLATGLYEAARSILQTFATYVNQGMLPNRFPDQGDKPEYNTADATLWYFEAIRAYVAETHDVDMLREIFPLLEDIIQWHRGGTRFNIQQDPDDGLLFAGGAETQVTWMDVKIDGWAVTPRAGKPVEINALWFNALMAMDEFERLLGYPSSNYASIADWVRSGFKRFWNPERGYLFDVLDGPNGNDPVLRPNQLFALSLHYSPLEEQYKKPVVDSCARGLLTSFGLRSLAPVEPGYIGIYGGNRWRRDTAYHQGTVWGWLIGPFLSAHLKVYGDIETAWSFLEPLFTHLTDQGLGSISEIFNGDPPHQPAGCIAQAWSVAEVLRVIHQLTTYRN
jgi:predicted glycogen debranching enzyme